MAKKTDGSKTDWLRQQREKQYDENQRKTKKHPRTTEGGPISDYNSGESTGTRPKRGRPRKRSDG